MPAASPYPLCEPISGVAPRGRTRKSSGTGRSSITGVPSASAIQPGRTSAPARFSSTILLPATALIEASKMNGASSPAGAAIAIGFSPTRASAPNVGATSSPPTVIAMPIMSCASASCAWYAAAPKCPPPVATTVATPQLRAFSIAISIACGPIVSPSPPSESTTAAAG